MNLDEKRLSKLYSLSLKSDYIPAEEVYYLLEDINQFNTEAEKIPCICEEYIEEREYCSSENAIESCPKICPKYKANMGGTYETY